MIMSIVMAAVLALAPTDGQLDKKEASPWQATFAAVDEPGERMVVSGVVYAADGKTPVKDVLVYAFHTDVKGYYNERNRMGNDDPRLKGTMRTGEDGRYEIDSIRPASYPGGRNPAHVHYVVTDPAGDEHRFELLFEDDELITSRMRSRAEAGNFYIIRPIEKDDDGVWHCRADLILTSYES